MKKLILLTILLVGFLTAFADPTTPPPPQKIPPTEEDESGFPHNPTGVNLYCLRDGQTLMVYSYEAVCGTVTVTDLASDVPIFEATGYLGEGISCSITEEGMYQVCVNIDGLLYSCVI